MQKYPQILKDTITSSRKQGASLRELRALYPNVPKSTILHWIKFLKLSADGAKIALAMLCLGEASKYNPKVRSAFSLGSSSSKIVVIFLQLLKLCFSFDIKKVRCTEQCRADQDVDNLEVYWQNITKIPSKYCYKAQNDKRTAGKPAKKTDYKGVLRIDYFDTKVQLELETISNLVYYSLLK